MNAVYACYIGYGISIAGTITTGSILWGLAALGSIVAFAYVEKKGSV